MKRNHNTIKNAKVFIADDDKFYCSALSNVLIKSGFKRISTFHTGVSLLSSLNTKPDIIILDYYLGKELGEDILAKIKMALPEVLVLVISSQADVSVTLKLLNSGATDYLIKQIDQLDKVPQALKRLLKGRQIKSTKQVSNYKTIERQYSEIKKLNDELDQFIYSISHELKGPLQAVKGVVHLAKKEKMSNDVNNYLHLIERSVHKFDAVLEHTNNYFLNKSSNLYVEEVQLHEIFDDLIIETSAGLSNMPVINYKITGDPVKLMSDELRLKLIIEQILDNAVKYTINGSPINIDVKKSIHEVVISITDQGIGIKPEVMPYILNLFYRGSERSKGSGMGLYIAHESVRKLNGSMTIDSEFGVGTTVKIRVPNFMQKTRGVA